MQNKIRKNNIFSTWETSEDTEQNSYQGKIIDAEYEILDEKIHK